jgi:hypothetical protein|eukprot:COSAG01_NODE_132_length_24759_cov_13.862298_19_plen_337_part_00
MPGVRQGSEQYGYGRLVAHNATHLTWTQVANAAGGGIIDEWTVVQHMHGRFHPGPGLSPTPPAPVPAPAPVPGPPVKANLRLVSLDICRHYWNWACNASAIPGGPEGGGQGSCCMANSTDPWFSWRDQGSGSPTDLQLYTARPASADPFYFAHTLPTGSTPPASMPEYRLGDYGESSYFGPAQGPNGVWNGVETNASGFGRWAYGSGAPRALIEPASAGASAPSSRFLAQPIGFELLLHGGPATRGGLPFVSPVAIWKPIAPPGFTALGAIISPGPSHRPKLSACRVLADECVAMCTAKQIWCDAKTPRGHCAPVSRVFAVGIYLIPNIYHYNIVF